MTPTPRNPSDILADREQIAQLRRDPVVNAIITAMWTDTGKCSPSKDGQFRINNLSAATGLSKQIITDTLANLKARGNA